MTEPHRITTRRRFITGAGAALLAALSSGFGPMPAMEVVAQGFGAYALCLTGRGTVPPAPVPPQPAPECASAQ